MLFEFDEEELEQWFYITDIDHFLFDFKITGNINNNKQKENRKIQVKVGYQNN